MRGVAGTFCILFLMGAFSLLLMEGAAEYQDTRSLHVVLDEEIPVKKAALPQTSLITDQDGAVVSEIFSGENRINLTFDEIPATVLEALVAVEDQAFFDHQGFDIQGMTRALLVNLESRSVEQGGSTVTQQLARNVYLTHEQTYERKLTELLYAYQLERHLSKEEILELYVNVLYFHNGVYGIEAASRFYFNKPAEKLSLAEAAFLVAIPNRPEYYNPLLHKENTEKRKEWVLKKMKDEELITYEQFDQAKEEAIVLNVSSRIDDHPDYVTYVHHEFKELVGISHGFKHSLRQAVSDEKREEIHKRWNEKTDELLAGGITIHTALDPAKQVHVVNKVNAILGPGELQGSAVMIDNLTGEIVALSGGKSYRKFDFNRAYQAYNQPGSAMKPLLSFVPYLEYTGLGPSSIVDAGPYEKNGYSPNNFGGAVYGKVPLEKALASSYNTAAVRMLDQTGIEQAFSYIEQFDFSRLSAKDRVLSSALGTMEVSLLELTGAYTPFANDGHYVQPRAIRNVTDQNGHVLYEWEQKSEQVWSEETNDKMRRMLQAVIQEGTGTAAQLPGNGYAGGKTGTTSSFHDLWFVGLNDRYTTGVWLGKDAPGPIIEASNGSYHTRLWKSIMDK
ncbi:penicillin-binding protein [Bacillus sp. H-16]|uniref:transglycosylase domain-containing protein n=1 Tax=Alteribacter salitolerans TaxID=2912333 RepID=UPI0019638BCF|nr:transglycosylase domain-containing protein [Alteribacter salitolerans]MBM7097509.1 penicillin-binding protein [Alteribacter salitolerans]